MFVQGFLVQLLLKTMQVLHIKNVKGGPHFFFFPPPPSQEHQKSDSDLTCNFKQNQIDHHYAVANINLVSCMTKLPIGKHHLTVEGKEKSPQRQCLTH